MDSKNDLIEFIKSSWFVPVLALLVVVLVLVKTFDFSLTDFVADRVIQKLEADYSPFGPNGHPPQSPDGSH